MCSSCNERPAVMEIAINENGKVTTLHLCEECAVKKGWSLFSPFSLGDVFHHAIRSEHDELRCERCGMTLSEFKRLGVVGCQDCYQNLRAGTDPVLRQVQKGMRHTGRRPVGHAAAKLSEKNTVHSPLYINKREQLQMELNVAIERENFEDAARLRDQIKALEAAEKSGVSEASEKPVEGGGGHDTD